MHIVHMHQMQFWQISGSMKDAMSPQLTTDAGVHFVLSQQTECDKMFLKIMKAVLFYHFVCISTRVRHMKKALQVMVGEMVNNFMLTKSIVNHHSSNESNLEKQGILSMGGV